MIDITIDPTYLVRYELCDSDNEEALSEMYIAWLGLLRDSPLSESSKRPVRVIREFLNELLQVPFPLIVKKYGRLLDMILVSPTLYGAGSITGEFYPEFADTPIYFEYIRWTRTGDPNLYQWILSFLKFPKKFEYHSDGLHDVTLRKWRASEERLSSLVLDERVCEHLKVLTDKMVFAYEAIQFEPMLKHGPGTVSNTRRGSGNKSKASYLAPSLMEFYEQEGLLEANLPNIETKFVPGLDDVAEWLKAPKNAEIMRSICREPAGHMYAQQGVLYNLLHALSYGPITRFVDLTDQQANRDAALFGSYTGLVDTIDLASASDLVSFELICRTFPPRLLSHLIATRTSKVRIRETGEVIEVRKFAPMGSALCFPVQCIVYTVSVIYAHMIVQAGEDPNALEDVISGCRSDAYFASWLDRTFSKTLTESEYPNRYMPPRVFGDDIVCDFRVTDTLSKLLESLGFLVNQDKSFTGSQAVRESCGGYYYNGHDVTPIYWTPWNQDFSVNQAIVPLVAFANRAHQFGYHGLRTTMIHLVRDRLAMIYGDKAQDAIRWSSDPIENIGFAFYTSKVRPTYSRNRYNVELQRFEVRILGVKVRKKHYDNEEFERWRYHSWFVNAKKRAPVETEERRLNLFERWGETHHQELMRRMNPEPSISFSSVVDFSISDSEGGTKILPFSKPGISWDSSLKWKWHPL